MTATDALNARMLLCALCAGAVLALPDPAAARGRRGRVVQQLRLDTARQLRQARARYRAEPTKQNRWRLHQLRQVGELLGYARSSIRRPGSHRGLGRWVTGKRRALSRIIRGKDSIRGLFRISRMDGKARMVEGHGFWAPSFFTLSEGRTLRPARRSSSGGRTRAKARTDPGAREGLIFGDGRRRDSRHQDLLHGKLRVVPRVVPNNLDGNPFTPL